MSKSIRPTSRKTTRPQVTAPKIVRQTARPTHEQIAARAFTLYLSRGCVDGQHEQDWLQAEAELSRG